MTKLTGLALYNAKRKRLKSLATQFTVAELAQIFAMSEADIEKILNNYPRKEKK